MIVVWGIVVPPECMLNYDNRISGGALGSMDFDKDEACAQRGFNPQMAVEGLYEADCSRDLTAYRQQLVLRDRGKVWRTRNRGCRCGHGGCPLD
jgi:hypothetical protein